MAFLRRDRPAIGRTALAVLVIVVVVVGGAIGISLPKGGQKTSESTTTVASSTSSSSTSFPNTGLVTPVNSTEVTPPSSTAQFSNPPQNNSGQLYGDNAMFEGVTPSAMQVDSTERGNDWEWWTMVM